MRYIKNLLNVSILLVLLIPLAGCRQDEQPTFQVTVIESGKTRSMTVNSDVTVADVLHKADITLSDMDRVNPPRYSRATNGMTIKVVHVREETTIAQEAVPFERRTTLNDGLATGERRLLQAGVNGVAEITVRVTYEDDVEVSRNEVRRVVIVSPQTEVVMIGSQGQLAPVAVSGTLAYISTGNAWIIRRNSSERRPLTLEGGLDGLVFQLSKDGKQLLFTQSMGPVSSSTPNGATPLPQATPVTGGAFNSLWMITDTTKPDSKPIPLRLYNILYADILPSNMIVYSTAEPRPSFPGWQANNDLWSAKVNARGGVNSPKLLLPLSSGGLYGWYGTFFALSPDGQTWAWSQADSVGVLKPAEVKTPQPGKRMEGTLERQTLLSFAPRNAYDFVWVPSVSWSPDGTLLATTTHGAPLGNEAPEDSPVFNLTLLPAQGGYSIDLLERAGMRTAPQFSPQPSSGADILLAYLKAIQPLDSRNSRYQLFVADRDGSNSRLIFPQGDQPGLSAQLVTWSPDARQIALIYQGNLYLLDITTGLAQQLTQDSLSSNPRWSP